MNKFNKLNISVKISPVLLRQIRKYLIDETIDQVFSPYQMKGDKELLKVFETRFKNDLSDQKIYALLEKLMKEAVQDALDEQYFYESNMMYDFCNDITEKFESLPEVKQMLEDLNAKSKASTLTDLKKKAREIERKIKQLESQ